jgi:cytochrome c peroxidase
MCMGWMHVRDAFQTNIEIPVGWPEPSYDVKRNPLSKEGFELGRKLFYDPSLSLDSTVSCASCHLQYTGFAHVDHNVSHGIKGRKGNRNAPGLMNLAWNKTFHWDGGVLYLDAQALNPIEHPAEMGNTLVEVLRRLNQSEKYRSQFEKVFGTAQIGTEQLLKAFSQFTVQLISSNSKYDMVMRKQEGAGFTDQEERGLSIFRKHCASCHQEPLFKSDFFASNGLKPDTNLQDEGRYQITQNRKDRYLFRVPTLRNIEYTYPYMHDGRFNKLKEVIQHYSDGINPKSENLHKFLKKPIHLNENQKKDLLAFLRTLTDKSFLFDKSFSFPKE